MSSPITKAENILRLFLNVPAHEIKCECIRTSSAVIKCEHKDKKYIVKLFDDSDFGKNEITWFKHAADLGIGPHVYQADTDLKYIIIEYVEGHSLTAEQASKSHVLKEIAHTLAILHSSTLAGVQKKEIFPQIYAKYEKLKTGGDLQKLLSSSFRYIQIIEKKVRKAAVPLVPCHNDLNPGNIFIKKDKIVIIDWGDAAISNPYYDIVAFFVLNVIPKQRQLFFLQYYSNKLPQPNWHKYLDQLTQMVRFEFALNLLTGVQHTKTELLFQEHIPKVQPIAYYLTNFPKDENVDINYLYEMAIASLLAIKHPLYSMFVKPYMLKNYID